MPAAREGSTGAPERPPTRLGTAWPWLGPRRATAPAGEDRASRQRPGPLPGRVSTAQHHGGSARSALGGRTARPRLHGPPACPQCCSCPAPGAQPLAASHIAPFANLSGTATPRCTHVCTPPPALTCFAAHLGARAHHIMPFYELFALVRARAWRGLAAGWGHAAGLGGALQHPAALPLQCECIERHARCAARPTASLRRASKTPSAPGCRRCCLTPALAALPSSLAAGQAGAGQAAAGADPARRGAAGDGPWRRGHRHPQLRRAAASVRHSPARRALRRGGCCPCAIAGCCYARAVPAPQLLPASSTGGAGPLAVRGAPRSKTAFIFCQPCCSRACVRLPHPALTPRPTRPTPCASLQAAMWQVNFAASPATLQELDHTLRVDERMLR